MRRGVVLLFALIVSLSANPARAARVIALAPHLAELTCAAGACDQLVGAVKHSDYPDAVARLAQVGDAHAVSLEAVLALKPDLILAWDGGTPAATMARLRDLGLRVESVRVQTLADVGLALLRLGALLGTEDAACQEEARFRAAIDGLRTRYAHAPPLDVMYQLESEPVFTINRASPISEAMAVCGARNVFGDMRSLAGAVGREAVLAANPGAIVFGRQDDGDGIRRGWRRFPSLLAVRANNLIAVDADRLARATPRMAEGTAALCEALDQARARIAALKPAAGP